MIAFSNDELNRLPRAKPGDTLTCTSCGEQHTLIASTDREGRENTAILFYRCHGTPCLGAVNGHRVAGA